LETFVKIHKGKYLNIHVVASLAAALSQYHDAMGTKLVDTLLHNIVNGLEV
jgi:regulator of nonsense transcripts 2